MKTRLIIPFLHDGSKFYPNPNPENVDYPVGTGFIVADERAKFIPGTEPISSEAVMTYRYNDKTPYTLERGLIWPEAEYPCLTVDYSITDPARGADMAEYAAFWKMTAQPVAFEFAFWDNDMRGSGEGSRDPNSTLGRLWPAQGEPKYVLTVRVAEGEAVTLPSQPTDGTDESTGRPWYFPKSADEVLKKLDAVEPVTTQECSKAMEDLRTAGMIDSPEYCRISDAQGQLVNPEIIG